MIHSSRAGRIAAGVIVVLVVAAVATAGMHWSQWRPSTACLFCGAGDLDTSTAASAAGTAGATGSTRGSAVPPPGAARAAASAMPSSQLSTRAADANAPQGRVIMGRQAWQPWGSQSGPRRSYFGDMQAPSSSLGGLWRLMSVVSHGSNAPAAAPQTARAERAASTPRQPRSAPPAAGPRPPAASRPAPPPAAPPLAEPPVTVLVPPTDPFHDHDTPLPDPFGPPAPGGPLDPGGPGGVGGGGGDLSPNPEPASMLLIGTGLIGIYGALRRRNLL